MRLIGQLFREWIRTGSGRSDCHPTFPRSFVRVWFYSITQSVCGFSLSLYLFLHNRNYTIIRKRDVLAFVCVCELHSQRR